MSQLLGLIAKIAPPPAQPAPRVYDGLQYKLGPLVFRPAQYGFEAAMLAVLGGYLTFYFLGRAWNDSRARSTVAKFTPLLQSQFATLRPLLTSSPALHLLYATGRRNVLSLHLTVQLAPAHDLLSLLVHIGRSVIEPTYAGAERLTWLFTLGRADRGLQEPLGVWAVIDKSAMVATREKRWDLTFARLQENAKIPMTHALFAEHSDLTDVYLKTANVGVAELLANPVAASVLRYLIVTDVSATRPERGPLRAQDRSREVVLSTITPSESEQAAAVNAWAQVALNIADLVAKPNLLKPDVSRKFVKTRQTVDAELAASHKKVLADDAIPEETAEDKRAARKRAERAAMSEKELKKAEELERKREARKQAKKQAASGRPMM
ncbi:hypothetical protein Q5752_001783 [Cryptotrichosporon argae]